MRCPHFVYCCGFYSAVKRAATKNPRRDSSPACYNRRSFDPGRGRRSDHGERMTTSRYKLRFWGARGTVPAPSADKLVFGGNTSCLSVAISDGEHIILDCGTGVRLLGNSLAQQTSDVPVRYHIFLTHYHFDHVEGLPLFQPLYDPNSRITIHGFETGGQSVRQVLESLIRPPYFPVSLAAVPSQVDYVTVDSTPRVIGGVTVEALGLTHPDGSLSFRLDSGDRRIVYATDHEHGVEETDRALVEFARDADHLIYDTTYMRAEYEALRRGWGHSTWYAAVQIARAAKVKTLILFHHHPEHTDDELRELLRVTSAEFPSTEAAREGLELPL
jgi:phosphoribosyl 1,2-cyclic phosphodiesterase